ncbi:SDR family NAD(P)-dependent oxidoreductase [Mycolicibacterium sp. jd]|uniref:2-hydroxycyclohexanecarboxyl-CoA dehydrogenase n=2 Tax=Mycobacteriaceae TaxID=1762 RepID=A0A1Y0CHC6_9MYCO|nr:MULTISPECIES: glucose 1-dehydrogenase [Mycobacteriaceae]ART74444.1 2-hydroxycyclohexanecarboxyl-CoA dehydrogenase [Mycobacterium dioxanotrophicus]MDN4517326.1 glucose 1-dehydrogenase [Mycolicibacterium austroafricanum]UJL30639.1 glucose 1-dehydrogenase [Mycolicibacterium vanbaalenii]WND56257.1 glucose 1-dehydrogenase [Mycolicibacterium vanbaalenii]
MTRLDGRTALVTGGAGGIGAAICRHLAEAGARVAVCDLDLVGAEETASALPGTSAGFAIDVTDSSAVARTVDAVRRQFGEIEILVNNAGIDTIEKFVDSTEETWRALVTVNYLGTVIVSRAVLDSMIERRRGRIINIGSDAGRVGSAGEVVYSGTKGAIIAFSKGLAREMATKGVTVNTVCPGPTNTALLKKVAAASQGLYDALARAIPMKRIGTPDDIAPAVVFFAGDGASYITGQTLSVSGGLTMV